LGLVVFSWSGAVVMVEGIRKAADLRQDLRASEMKRTFTSHHDRKKNGFSKER